MTPERTKKCRRCGLTKPAEGFAAHKQTLDGLQAWCRQCKTDDMRLRRARIAKGTQ